MADVLVFKRIYKFELRVRFRLDFTHIIQLWHDGSASTHLKFKQVEYLLRVTQRLQDVHVTSGVQRLLWQTDKM